MHIINDNVLFMLNDIICVIYMFFIKISLTTPEDVTEDTKQNQRAGRPT